MDAQKRGQPRPMRSRLRRKQALPRAPRQAVNLHHDFGIRLLKLANVAMISLPFVLVWLLYYIRMVLMYPSIYRAGGIIVMFIVSFGMTT